MIIQSKTKPELLLPDMSFWVMTTDQTFTEISKKYKVLCPTILYSEIYNPVKGANKRLKNPFEVLYIDPWQLLVKNELEGRTAIQNDSIALVNLKSEQDMSEEEKDVVESAKKLVENFDKEDKFLSAQSPTSRGVENNALVSFANASYQNLTWNQFIRRFKKVSKGTIFEPIARIVEMPATDRNITRTAIEKALSEYAKLYPINNFEKTFAFSRGIMEDNFIGVCNDIFIPMLEEHLGFDRTHWDNTRDRLTDNHIRKNFSYTWYALYHYLAFQIYQNENAYSNRVGSRDFEYLYYLHSTNVLFVSADAQHKEYITEAGILKSRVNSSFAYIPYRDHDPDEHDKVMKYIKEGVLY